MAEESLAFYLLIVTVMIAAGYDALDGRRADPARRRDRRARLDDQPVRHRHRVGLRRDVSISDRASSRRIVILVIGTAIGIWWVMRYAAKVATRTQRRRSSPPSARRTSSTSRPPPTDGGRHGRSDDRPHKLVLRAVLPRLRGDDRRRHPVERPRDQCIADPLLVVPRDDGLVPRCSRSSSGSSARMGEGAVHRRVRRRRPRPARGRADHRHRPRRDRDHDQRPDHRHRPELRPSRRSPGLGGVAFINIMYGLFLPLSFLIPSSSGLATVAMPIMAPLASFANVPAGRRRDGLPDRQRPGEPRHADVGGRHGRARDRPGAVRHVDPVRAAASWLLAVLCMLVLSIGRR